MHGPPWFRAVETFAFTEYQVPFRTDYLAAPGSHYSLLLPGKLPATRAISNGCSTALPFPDRIPLLSSFAEEVPCLSQITCNNFREKTNVMGCFTFLGNKNKVLFMECSWRRLSVTWQAPGIGLKHVELGNDNGRERNREDLPLQVMNQQLLVGGTEPEPNRKFDLPSTCKHNARTGIHYDIEEGWMEIDYYRSMEQKSSKTSTF